MSAPEPVLSLPVWDDLDGHGDPTLWREGETPDRPEVVLRRCDAPEAYDALLRVIVTACTLQDEGLDGLGPEKVEAAGRVFAALAGDDTDPVAVPSLSGVRAVLALHVPVHDVAPGKDPYCRGCWEAGGMDGAPSWPCPTVRALAGEEA